MRWKQHFNNEYYTIDTRATLLLTDGAWTVVNDPNAEARHLLQGIYDVDY